MKLKLMLSTVAVMTAITAGTLTTVQTAHAESTEIKVEQSAKESTPKIRETFLQHYNVLRIELEQPYLSNNSILLLMHGEYNNIGTVVEEDGKTMAFDINLDEFAKEYPNKKDRKKVVSELHLMDLSFDPEKGSEKIEINDKFVTATLINAVNQGQLIGTGYVSYFTNFTKLEGYDKFITKDAYADNTLNKQMTSKTGGLIFKYNKEFAKDYSFSLTNEAGAVVGMVVPLQNPDDLVVKETRGKFVGKEYTISATSKSTGEKIDIAKLNPFNLF